MTSSGTIVLDGVREMVRIARTTDGMDYEAKSPLQERIQEILRGRGLHRYIEPRLIEGWLRYECRRDASLDTTSAILDALTPEEFLSRVNRAIQIVLWDRDGQSEQLAMALGL